MPTPHDLELLEPAPCEGFSGQPELSIVLPALNEALTIEECVDWCRQGFQAANVAGEVLIVDSSSDGTGDLALARGARVLRSPKQGLGKAYTDALPFIRGKYVVMGDVDLTYDFREIQPFLDRFREGFEYVMGSRFRGSIEAGAMPPLHQYFGTPLTTWILNRLFGSHFSDIHCGMRGITLEALRRMDLRSRSWEYASEMVIKSVQMGLRIAEVPVRFHKDRQGRLSHHRRSGWWSPWSAGWINLRAMFVHGSNFFLEKPGWLMLGLGLLLTFPLSFGPVKLGPLTLSIYWMLAGTTLGILGLQALYMSILARVFFDHSGAIGNRWLSRYSYTRTVLMCCALSGLGVLAELPLIRRYLQGGFRLDIDLHQMVPHLALAGLFLIIASFLTFTFTLILHGFFAAVPLDRRGKGGLHGA